MIQWVNLTFLAVVVVGSEALELDITEDRGQTRMMLFHLYSLFLRLFFLPKKTILKRFLHIGCGFTWMIFSVLWFIMYCMVANLDVLLSICFLFSPVFQELFFNILRSCAFPCFLVLAPSCPMLLVYCLCSFAFCASSSLSSPCLRQTEPTLWKRWKVAVLQERLARVCFIFQFGKSDSARDVPPPPPPPPATTTTTTRSTNANIRTWLGIGHCCWAARRCLQIGLAFSSWLSETSLQKILPGLCTLRVFA